MNKKTEQLTSVWRYGGRSVLYEYQRLTQFDNKKLVNWNLNALKLADKKFELVSAFYLKR